MLFADVADIEARWRTLSDTEQARAEAKLTDASALISALLKKSGVAIDDSDDEQAEALRYVTCSMVIRSMSAGEYDAFGVTNQTTTAGPYSQTFTFSNPSGDMYLTRLEKSLLGINTSGYIGTIRPMMAGEHD